MTAEKNPFAKFLTHFDNGHVLFQEGDNGDEMFGDMIKANPEIAVRMLRKQSIRLRETNRQLENLISGGAVPSAAAADAAPAATPSTSGTLQAEAKGYFIS